MATDLTIQQNLHCGGGTVLTQALTRKSDNITGMLSSASSTIISKVNPVTAAFTSLVLNLYNSGFCASGLALNRRNYNRQKQSNN